MIRIIENVDDCYTEKISKKMCSNGNNVKCIIPANQEKLLIEEPILFEHTLRDKGFKQRSLTVDVLCFVFGFGSWVAMTGLWVELPLLVRRLPEGPHLAASLSMMLQGANVGCFLYALVYRLRPRRSTEDYFIHLQMALGSISCFLLIFCWDMTTVIGGVSRSVPLLVLSFGMSLVDCVSSVSFLPYMARFRSLYMTPYLVGEGMGGFIPSLLAIAQGIGGEEDCSNHTTAGNWNNGSFEGLTEPRFSEGIFMAFLLVIFLSSWAGFALLNYLPIAKREQAYVRAEAQQQSYEKVYRIEEPRHPSLSSKSGSSRQMYAYLMFLQGWACIATFGIFPAIQPFSLIPYGYESFHLCATLCGLAYPLACAVGIFVTVKHPAVLGMMTIVASSFGAFIFVSAVLSPRPPLHGTSAGAVIMVFSWVIFTLLFSYIKTMATVALLNSDGHGAMFWVGVVTQVGGIFGAAVMFLLVNVLDNVFHDPGQCEI